MNVCSRCERRSPRQQCVAETPRSQKTDQETRRKTAFPDNCLSMDNIELGGLTKGERARLNQAVRTLRHFAKHSHKTEGEALSLLTAACSSRHGGARRGAGRPAIDWSAQVGQPLFCLGLRVAVEKALAETQAEVGSRREIFVRLVSPVVGLAAAEALYPKFENGLKRISNAEFAAYRKHRERVRGDRPRAR